MALPRTGQPMTIYGYAPVSTDRQTLDAQQLKSAGASKVISEKQSGAKSDRAELAKLLKKLAPTSSHSTYLPSLTIS
jgi:DNA invertase Pin-like site-specific DNA recombinase